MTLCSIQKFKQIWPLALIQQAQAAITTIAFASNHLKPFTLSLSKRSAMLRQAQPERVWHVDARQVIRVSHAGASA
jgi:hypothetical protein